MIVSMPVWKEMHPPNDVPESHYQQKSTMNQPLVFRDMQQTNTKAIINSSAEFLDCIILFLTR